MSRLLPVAPVARGIAAVGAVAAYQAGAHYAAATPGAHGFGLAMALVPPLLALGAALRSPHRAWLVPAWLLCRHRAVGRACHSPGISNGACIWNTRVSTSRWRCCSAARSPPVPPLCTRFATMIHGAVTPAVARYTRQITLAWTLFFVAIAAVSTLLFATAPIVTWSTFANYLSLPLVAVMFAAEHACRRFALPHEPRPRMVDAVRAYRATTHASQPSR